MLHRTGKEIGTPEQTGGVLHPPLAQKETDAVGADRPLPVRDRREDQCACAVSGEQTAKRLRVPGRAAAEGEVIPADRERAAALSDEDLRNESSAAY